MRKPRVLTKCVANAYTSNAERIVEFSNGARDETYKGGLIAFRNLPDGTLLINLYRMDKGVTVRVAKERDE